MWDMDVGPSRPLKACSAGPHRRREERASCWGPRQRPGPGLLEIRSQDVPGRSPHWLGSRKGRGPGLGYRGRELSGRTPRLGAEEPGMLGQEGERGRPRGAWAPGLGGQGADWEDMAAVEEMGAFSAAPWGFPAGSDGKESACQCKRRGLDPWVGKIPWRRKRQATPVFWPGEAHGQRSLAGCRPGSCKQWHTTERLTLSHTWSRLQRGVVRKAEAQALLLPTRSV